MDPGSSTLRSLEERQGDTPEGDDRAHLSVQTLTREARKVMDDLDLDLSQNRLQRIIRRFGEGRGDIDFRTWVITHADPTGETAVRNVVKARGH